MLITNFNQRNPLGGREKLCKLNCEIILDIFEKKINIIELNKYHSNTISSIIKKFSGKIDGINNESINNILDQIRILDVNWIIIDGSNLGELARIIKNKFPKILIITFFHNVEAKFFWDSFKSLKNLRSLSIFIVNYLAEKKAVKYSNVIITLNQRDSNLLFKIYGKYANYLIPMSLKDDIAIEELKNEIIANEKFALFVGGDFFANIKGITWFIKSVVPNIKIKIVIVGRGFDKYKSFLEIKDKVEIIGEVQSLAEWYQKASFVIAPIFEGSGMKTKVAEALMYGKRVIGTPEAFTGYEDIIQQVGYVCTTKQDFIDAISFYQSIQIKQFDVNLRGIYESKYSYESARCRFEAIFKNNSLI